MPHETAYLNDEGQRSKLPAVLWEGWDAVVVWAVHSRETDVELLDDAGVQRVEVEQ
jgi:hypothetical protein